jgi:colanic acid/amylovoran biosynthesis glycosyltransferase
MKIGFLVNGFPKISETFILNQVVGLLSAEQQLAIFARSKPDETVTHDLIEDWNMREKVVYSKIPTTYPDGVRILSKTVPQLAIDGDVSLRTIWSELRQGKAAPHRLANLERVLGSDGFDVYHAHFGSVGNAFLGVTKCRSEPYIASFYGRDASQLLREEPDRYDDLFRRVDAVTALSEDMRSTLVDAGCPRNKTHIQPLCVDTRRFSYRPRTREDGEPLRLLTVARFVEKKGLEYALRAVADLAKTHDVKYTTAWDGDRRERIESLMTELELEEVVNLLGWQPQSTIVDLMTNAHLFLLPSVTAENGDKEGTPTVLLEAQAMGLPIISTYHAGIPEIVADGKSGLLVPERDSEALADALATLAESQSRWTEMGRHGSNYVESKHSIDAVSTSLLDLYKSI